MKSFDYTTALLGKPVMTNEGRRVHEIFSSEHRNYLTVLVDGITYPLLFDYNGKLLDTSGTEFKTEKHSITNLYMAPIKKRGYINLYPKYVTDESEIHYRHGKVYGSIEEAVANERPEIDLISTIEIEWEE